MMSEVKGNFQIIEIKLQLVFLNLRISLHSICHEMIKLDADTGSKENNTDWKVNALPQDFSIKQ